ncbi:hypothetical protein NQZ68_029744, partial [Dissostichus eleginoides]
EEEEEEERGPRDEEHLSGGYNQERGGETHTERRPRGRGEVKKRRKEEINERLRFQEIQQKERKRSD